MLEQPPITGPSMGLRPDNLTVPKEKKYFLFVVIISIAAWAALAVSIVGLLYAALFGVFLWLGSGLLTAHLRADAVRVGPDQLPALDATLRDVCARLGKRDVPALYVLQSGGLLNAFATRFAGRDFVVVYSDFLEALGPDSAEMRFILGHEIGHIESRHVFKQILLAPGLLFPLAGPAYRRAWETTCDRFGAFAAQDLSAAARAMLVLSGGPGHGKTLNADAFAGQNATERGFFVSLHELTSTYPTLSRRVTDLLALRDGRAAQPPQRNPLAYLCAMFVPGGNLGGGGPAAGLLLVVAMIGLLAAMAIPAFQKVRTASAAKLCLNNERVLEAALDQYRLERNQSAKTWDDVVGPDKFLPQMPKCVTGGTYTASFDGKAFHVTCSIPGHNPGVAAAPTAKPR